MALFHGIRFKLALAFAAMALVSAGLGAALLIAPATQAMTDTAFARIDAAAAAQTERTHTTVQGYLDIARLIASRTALRNGLAEFNRTHDPSVRTRIQPILEDAQATVSEIRRISVLTPGGETVASTGHSENRPLSGLQGFGVWAIEAGADGDLLATVSGPMDLNGETIGLVTVVIDARRLVALATDYTGLGRTGETALARRDEDGSIWYLTPSRFDPDAPWPRRAPAGDMEDLLLRGFAGEADILPDDVLDYRGVRVLAAVRPVPNTDWVVRIKIDQEEVLGFVRVLGEGIFLLSAAVIPAAILVGILLAGTFTKPVLALHAAATRLAAGDYQVRLKAGSRDELGLLTEQFNTMAEVLAAKESELVQRAEELERTNRELESFSYSVSHDLRAPLRAMDGFSRILQDEYGAQLPGEAQHYLERVRNNARQMGQLIDDLLAFSRLARQAVTREPLDCRQLVEDVVDASRHGINGRNVRFDIRELGGCQGDRTLLKQVWVNLVDNALKYSRTKEEAVIEIGGEERPGEHVHYVRDNGVGFDPRYAGKLFGVFQRLHGAGEFEGTGVGLAIVQRIVQRHGGRVWAEAELDKGATFYFSLPHTDTFQGFNVPDEDEFLSVRVKELI